LRAIAREDAGIWPSRDYASIRFVDTGDAADFTFSGFVLSLATSAAVQFGDIADPSTGQPAEPNPRAPRASSTSSRCCRRRRAAT
jgi:hypothetical protein